MTLVRFQSISKLIAFSLCIGLFTFTSCSDDDSSDSEPCPIPTIEGSITIDDNEVDLAIAQLLVSSSFDGDTFLFQLGGITGNCEELQSISLTINVPDGETIDGSYDIETFFEADSDDATGNVIIQNISTSSQSLSEIESGTVTVSENGESNFTLNVEAVPTQGAAVSLNVTHQF